MVGDAEASYLARRTSSSLRVEQLYAEGVSQPQHGGFGQEAGGPFLVSVEVRGSLLADGDGGRTPSICLGTSWVCSDNHGNTMGFEPPFAQLGSV